MQKSLETTVQSITPQRPEKAAEFSDFLNLQHDEESLKLQHGNLYVIYDFSSSAEFETQLISTVITDILHNTYYTSQSASPIQPLEKAAQELKERLSQLAKDYSEADVAFSIIMAVVWGEVLYIVSYGKNALYIRRDGQLKQIDTVSEGNFSIASGLVQDLDVVFLSTQHFVEQFSPDKIFRSTTPILQAQLDPKSSALVLKFAVVTEFSEAEAIDIVDPAVPLNVKKASDKKAYKLKKGLLKLRPSQTSNKKKLAGLAVFIILLALFAFSLLALAQQNEDQKKQEDVHGLIDRAKQLLSKEKLSEEEKQELRQTESAIVKEASDTEEVKGVSSKVEQALNLKRVDSALFYDLALAGNSVAAQELVYANDKVYVSDQANGKLYSSLLSTAKFSAESGTFADIKNLEIELAEDDDTIMEALAFTDSAGYQTKALVTRLKDESYKLQNPALVFPYLDFIYEIDGTKITKYTKGASGGLAATTWTTDDALADAIDFTIDESIFVLLTDGTIAKYTSGTKDEFELSGFDVTLLNPVKLKSLPEFSHMYILDKGNSRVVVIDKDGKFVAQYMDSDEKWTDLRDIAISADEQTLYVLSGNKVYEVGL